MRNKVVKKHISAIVRWVALVLALCMLLPVVYKIYLAYLHNSAMEDYFHNAYRQDELHQEMLELGTFMYEAEYTSYEEGTPIHRADLSKFHLYNSKSFASPLTLGTVVLPEDIHYYKTPISLLPSVTLKAGTEVYLFFWLQCAYGYGAVGLPTHVRGMHYAAPFVAAEVLEPEDFLKKIQTELAEMPKYYVSTDSLRKVAEAFYNTVANNTAAKNDELWSLNSLVYDRKVESGYWGEIPYTLETVTYCPPAKLYGEFLRQYGVSADFVAEENRYISDAVSYGYVLAYEADYMFERQHVRICPDFYHPYFDAANIGLLSAAGVLLTLRIVLRVRSRRTGAAAASSDDFADG